MKLKISHLFLYTCILLLLFGVLFQCIPYFLNSLILPQLIGAIPYQTKRIDIQNLTPWGIRGALQLSDPKLAGISIPSFELSYSPESLVNKRVDTLLIDSASIRLVMIDGKPALPALETDTRADSRKTHTLPLVLPFTVEKIIFQNCTITTSDPDTQTSREHIFLVNFQVSPVFDEDNNRQLKSLMTSLKVRGDITLSGEIQADLHEDIVRLNSSVELRDLSDVNLFLPNSSHSSIAGRGSLTFETEIRNFKKVINYRIRGEFPDLRVSSDPVGFQSKENSVTTLEITGDTKRADFSLNNITLNQPEKIEINGDGNIDFNHIALTAQMHLLPERTNNPVTINLTGDRKEGTSHLEFSVHSDEFTIEEYAHFGPLSINGSLREKNNTFITQFNAALPTITHEELDVSATGISFAGKFQFPSPETGATRSPLSSGPGDGLFKIDSLSYKNTPSASLELSLRQENSGVDFDSVIQTPFSQELKLSCLGSMLLKPSVSLQCELPPVEFDIADLPPFIQLPESLSASGTLAGEADISMNNSGPEGNLTLRLIEAEITSGETTISDLNTEVHFPDITTIQSAPSQILTVESIESGTIKMNQGRILFRIEGSETIFIEKGALSWCNGKVETGSIMLGLENDLIETTLYCDRLGFTELLGQFGIMDTGGQGSLNGKLPVKLSSTGLSIDDGFLFSTPGNSGIIRFHNTDQLRQGLPDIKDSPYLDYSMQALENFAYNWTKLTFTTEADTLLLAMQLDGKPEKPLPFGYKKGQIVPTEKGPGLQHPIRLDVNFRLPLEDIFQYGRNIQSIMENF